MGDTVWNVWNLHLEAYDEATRQEQLARMAEKFRGDTHLMLAAGDYNEQRVDVLREFSHTSGLQSCGYALDYVVYADGLKLVDKGYQDCRASDHFPVWATFKISLK